MENLEHKELSKTIEENVTKENYNSEKETKILKIIGLVIAVLLIVILVTLSVYNNRKADIIYSNFLGQTFKGEYTSDDGFFDDYENNKLKNKIYTENVEAKSLEFNDDGTVYYKWTSSYRDYTYFEGDEEPKGTSYNYDGTYTSFDVTVSLTGQVYLVIGGEKYKVRIGNENNPYRIYNYQGMTLDTW